MKAIDLSPGCQLLLDEAFLAEDDARQAFAEIRDLTAWEQRPALFGHMQPRLTASYGDAGVTYRYSGLDNVAVPWIPVMARLKHRIEELGGSYNYCLLNRYRYGSDSMGWHADDEPGLGDRIASLSLGAPRTFRLRKNDTRETASFSLGNGALLIMDGATQRDWMHAIPKTKKDIGERINLTFRLVLPSETAANP